MSSDEFDLFSAYSYLFGNKRVKSKLSNFLVFLMQGARKLLDTVQDSIHVGISFHDIHLCRCINMLSHISSSMCGNCDTRYKRENSDKIEYVGA